MYEILKINDVKCVFDIDWNIFRSTLLFLIKHPVHFYISGFIYYLPLIFAIWCGCFVVIRFFRKSLLYIRYIFIKKSENTRFRINNKNKISQKLTLLLGSWRWRPCTWKPTDSNWAQNKPMYSALLFHYHICTYIHFFVDLMHDQFVQNT